MKEADKAKVSIIIPVHNSMPEVESTLVSVQKQSLEDIEILVVDDCSTDGSWEMVREQAEKDDRIRCIRMPANRGAGAARNEGLRLAHGEYIHFLDSDDVYYRRDSLKVLADAAGKNRCDVLVFEHVLFDRTNQVARPPITREERGYWRGRISDNRISFTIEEDPALLLLPAYPWNKLYRREFLMDHGIRSSETRVHNDLALVWQVFLSAERISLLQEPHVLHQYAPGVLQLSNDGSRRRFDVFRALADVDRFILKGTIGEQYRPWYSKFKVDTLCFGLGRISREHRTEFAGMCRTELKGSRVRDILALREQLPTWRSSMIKAVLVKYFPQLASILVKAYHRWSMRRLYRRAI